MAWLNCPQMVSGRQAGSGPRIIRGTTLRPLGLTRGGAGRVLILAASARSSPDSKNGMRIHDWRT